MADRHMVLKTLNEICNVIKKKNKRNLDGFWFNLDTKWKISGYCLVWIQSVTGTSPSDNKELERFPPPPHMLKPFGSVIVISSDHLNVTEFHPEIPLLQHLLCLICHSCEFSCRPPGQFLDTWAHIGSVFQWILDINDQKHQCENSL